MEILFVYKAVARENKLQLCFSVKGQSALGRSYRVINPNCQILDCLEKDGRFHGHPREIAVPNREIDAAIDRVSSIIDKYHPVSLSELLDYWDEKKSSNKSNMTLGGYLEQYIEDQKEGANGRSKSQGWRITAGLLSKVTRLGMHNIKMSCVTNDVFEKFCDYIRAGKIKDEKHPNRPQDQGCHGYRITVSLLKTLLNKAYRAKLIPEEITYNWSAEGRLPVATEIKEMARMNVPTEEEWEKFIKADLRRYAYANRDIRKLEMMRAVVIVLVETLSRPNDVLTMKFSDVSKMSWSYVPTKFKQYPIQKKRKYLKPVGLTNMAYKCVMKYSNKTNTGYVFPFKCNIDPNPDENDYMIKISNMGSKINSWLKLLTNNIFEKDVSLYSFRHFAITRALNRGMNVAEVAALAKTSIQQINSTYYERDTMASMIKLERLLNNS